MTESASTAQPPPATPGAATPGPASASPTRPSPVRLAVLVGALGVVFGDIGTSPLYTLQTIFNPDDPHPVPLSTENVYGVASLIFWSVTIIVTVTYVLLAMRADNDGEGGIMALITQLRRGGATGRGKRRALWLAGLGIFGAALFLGDGMITPAISVLSAVEGVKVVNPKLDVLIIPVTVVIIIGLFLVQRHGTAAVGRFFGPVMIFWFVVIGALGISGITRHAQILAAISPTYAAVFIGHHPKIAFFALAAIVLAVTGAEALFADMGHFGRQAITRGWLLLVFPACVLSYFGQAAAILADPKTVSNPFFLIAPGWSRIPLLVLATGATIIASQAVITGAYSVTAQAAELGYLPRLRITHTSESAALQIYVPWINWLLMVSVLTLVFAFRSSVALAFAFGMAVTATITITTILFFYVARRRWAVPLWLILVGAIPLVAIDLFFVAANLTKFLHGAWLPLLIGLIAFTVMATWQRGRRLVTKQRDEMEGSLQEFVDHLQSAEVTQVPGTAIFLNRSSRTVPLALRANVERNHVRHHHVAIVAIRTEQRPHVPESERAKVDPLGFGDDGIIAVTVRFGYADTPDVPAALATLDPEQTEGLLDLETSTYFLSKIELRPGPADTMAGWRKRLFIATSHITASAADHFRLPPNRTVIMGATVDV